MTVLDRYVTTRDELPAGLRLPPGPRTPTALQTVAFLALGPYLAQRWRRRYGDVFSVRVAPAGRAVVLSNPKDVREVFAGPADVFHAGEGNAILGPVMGEHSVLLLDEEAHRVNRKRVMAAFHGAAIRDWIPVIEQIAHDDVATWPTGTPFAVHQHLNDVSLEVIMRIVFGISDDARLAQMRPLLQGLVRIGPTVFLGWLYPTLEKVGPWKAFVELRSRTDELIYAEIAQRRTEPDLAERTDVLSKLLVADPSQSDAELRDHLVTLLLAGHETTASTLAWTLHDLVRDPQLYARVKQAALDGDEDYLEAVVKESLRLRPVIRNVARRLAKPVTVAGYDLPAGVVVFPSMQLVHHSDDVWDDAAAFRPERFLGKNPPSSAYFPFGGGLRRCLGAALATVEAVAVLKVVLRETDLAPVGRPEFSKVRNVTTVPGRGARLIRLPR